MQYFDITLSQLLDDGDTALVEEYHHVDGNDIPDIIAQYHERCVARSYVVSYTAVVTIKH